MIYIKTNITNQKIALIAMLNALAVGGQIVSLPFPGVSLIYLVIVISGIAYGFSIGACVGFLSMLISDIIVGFNPIDLWVVIAMSLIGAFSGILSKINFGQLYDTNSFYNRVFLGFYGVLIVIFFSLFTDMGWWFLWFPHTWNAYVTVALTGLAFNVPSMIFNAVLFGIVIPPVLIALRKAGLIGVS